MKSVAIISAGGAGSRMGGPKQFLKIAGKSMLEWTLQAFEETQMVDEIILVVNQENIKQAEEFKFSKLKKIVAAGAQRQLSVLNGLKVLPADCEIVLIHDGARPLIKPELIEQSIKEAQEFGAVVVGVPVKDTIKMTNDKLQMTNEGTIILKTLDRSNLWAAQTPQVFKKEIILKAYNQFSGQYQVTDDAMLVEKLGVAVKMIMGSYQNIKLTTLEDLKMAEEFMKEVRS